MAVEQGELKRIDIDRLELDLENPRHGRLITPEAAITHLVEKERVVELAQDISRKGGTNPMDLMGVVPRKGGRKGTYVSAEGNRRLCALMLLHDPEKIPAGILERSKKVRLLEAAAATASLPKQINCIVFSSKEEAMPWIEIMHIADQDGRARKRWTPDQQSNAIRGGRNYDAMQLLDLAQAVGHLDRQERDLKLTTVQRYLGNPVMRATLGIERRKDKTLAVVVDTSEFHKILETFISDVKDGKLSSRSDADAVKRYAAQLAGRVPFDRTPTESTPLADIKPLRQPAPPVAEPTPPNPDPLVPPLRPAARTVIGRRSEVEAELFAINADKLTSLYMSCVTLSLKEHTPLVTVGLWSLLESLASLHARAEQQFINYFNPQNLETKFGITEAAAKKSIRAALENISRKGNATKHHGVAASFDGAQLANDYDVLVPLLIAVCSRIPK